MKKWVENRSVGGGGEECERRGEDGLERRKGEEGDKHFW